MRVLSFKPGHDGAVALVEDGRLRFLLEAEKDSFERHSPVTAQLLMAALELADGTPDVLAIGGWHKHLPGLYRGIASGYLGLDAVETRPGRALGREVTLFSSSHERSHLFMAAGMAPSAPLEECAILVWEGVLGALYHWRDHGRRIERTAVLEQPGGRYSALFALADPSFPHQGHNPRDEDAGKLMALAAYGDGEPGAEERATVRALLEMPNLYPFDKASLAHLALCDAGVEDSAVARAAALITDGIFARFAEAASRWLPRGLPLLISGGCGLNCDWNRRWLDSGLFDEVFVPPCANDSGSALGTAIDAVAHLGGECRLDWSVYAGASFERDCVPDSKRWEERPLAQAGIAAALAAGDTVAWIDGRCEIGPRALGHRSLLASPLKAENRDLLNRIKRREPYRPVAPCCLEEELSRWFEPPIADPHMLFFADVTTDRLPAVTHVDGTARLQSVGPDGPAALRELLQAFRAETGFGVLCNTSLNYPGRGFINRSSELFTYAEDVCIDHVVIEDRWCRRLPA